MLVPNTTLRPSKKLSPIMMTVDPPVVHPSLGLRAFIHGVASGNGGYNPTANNYAGKYLSTNTCIQDTTIRYTYNKLL